MIYPVLAFVVGILFARVFMDNIALRGVMWLAVENIKLREEIAAAKGVGK